MSKQRRILMNASGQSLLMVVLLGCIITIAFAAVFFSNQIGTLHGTANSQRTKSQSVAEEGITYAIQQLSTNSTTWQQALQGNFPPDCAGNAVVSPSGGRFRLTCSNSAIDNPNLQSYEVAVTAVASTQIGNGPDTPQRALKAYMAQRTLGADLVTNVHAAAALQLVRQPSIQGSLNVHWGPIVCLDSTNASPWALPNLIDSGLYPRKFSAGGLTGGLGGGPARSATGLNSDQKEYWANASLYVPPIIDDAWYISQAQYSTGVPTPTLLVSGLTLNPGDATYPCLPAGNTTCGYFNPSLSGDTALFDRPDPGYPLASGVVYVNGDAQFSNIAIDSAAFVVKGNLTIRDATGGTQPNLHVPVTAPLEYPYYPTTPAAWPCRGKEGDALFGGMPKYDCAFPYDGALPGNVYFRGFLYVKGSLTVNAANWNMVGTLLVGDSLKPPGSTGLLIIPVGSALNLAYDDAINHTIAASLKLEPDQLQSVSAF